MKFKALLTFASLVFLFAVSACTGSEPTATPLPPEMWQELPKWAEVPTNPATLPLEACNNALATVNRANLLDVENCNQDLVNIKDQGIEAFPNEVMRRDLVPDVKALFDAAKAAGYPLRITSGWRDCAYQENVFASWVRRGNGDENFANTYTYHCGASTHHLGTTFDIVFGENGYEDGFGLGQAETETYKWLQENVANYGCVLEYPEGKQAITGLQWEPWHYRCGVPVEIAQQIMNGDFTLAEWLQNN